MLEEKFLDEWGMVFVNILGSVSNGQNYISQLQQLGIQNDNPKKYPSTIQTSVAEIESAFLGHLHLQFHTRYRLGQVEWCNRLAGFMKENYPEWYRKKEYGKYINRLRFTPGFLFGLVQRLKN